MLPAAAQTPADDTTEDAFLGGRLRLRQPRAGLRAGLDGVLLAAAVPIAAGQSVRVLDAGCGSGIVGLAIAVRVSAASICGIDIEPGLIDLARANASLNGLAERCRYHQADLAGPARSFAELGLPPAQFDHVVANPPFEREGERRPSREGLRERASAMAAGGLAVWARFLARMAKPGGTLTLIHRADALPELLPALAGRFGDLRVFPLYPRLGEPAIRIIVRGRRGSRGPLRLLGGMVLHGGDNSFRPEVAAVLRGEADRLELEPATMARDLKLP